MRQISSREDLVRQSADSVGEQNDSIPAQIANLEKKVKALKTEVSETIPSLKNLLSDL